MDTLEVVHIYEIKAQFEDGCKRIRFQQSVFTFGCHWPDGRGGLSDEKDGGARQQL